MIGHVERYRKLSGLVPVLLFCGCASTFKQDAALAVVPYTITDTGLIVVDANLNGQGPFRFILDTGASISVVFERPGNRLALEPIAGANVTIHGALGSDVFPLLNVDQLQFGRERWMNPRMASLPAHEAIRSDIDGILGIDFLHRYSVGFFTADRSVRLYSPDLVARKNYRGWVSIPMSAAPIGERGASLYLLEIEINDRKVAALFDLGAGLNMINWAAAQSLGVRPQTAKTGESVAGAFGSLPDTARIRIEVMSTSGISWRNEIFSVGDYEIFDIFSLGARPAAILGAGLFSRRDFVIDFAGNRLLVNVAMDNAETAPVQVE